MPDDATIRFGSRFVCLLVVVALGGIAGCSNGASDSAGNAGASPGSEKSTPAARTGKSSEDRGNAQFNVAGSAWTGNRASARIKDGNLGISASRMTRDGDTMKRDSLDIHIQDYQGPGNYKASVMSMFVRVSINMPKEGGSEADATKMLTDAIGDSSRIRLADADVEITSASGGYVDGRFSLDMPGMPDKAVSDGQFHARVRE